MPFRFRALEAGRVVIAVGRGPVDVTETTRMIREVAGASPGGRAVRVLVDVRRREGAPRPEEIRHFVRELRKLRGRVERVAMLAPAGALYGMARMTEIVAEGRPGPVVRAFTQGSEALRWLRAE